MALPQTPALTTDCVIFDPVGHVLLIRRKHEPSAGSHALPGGFVKIGETVEAACRREVREEAGVEVSELTLVGVYSNLKRDPRGHIVSVAYATELSGDALPIAGSDATNAEWVDTRKLRLVSTTRVFWPTPRKRSRRGLVTLQKTSLTEIGYFSHSEH